MSDSDTSKNPWLPVVSAVVGLASGFGTAKGFVEAWTGEDLITGERLSWWERGLGVLPIVGGIGKGAAVGADVVAIVDKSSDAATAAARAEELARTAKAGRELHRVAKAVDTYADRSQFADALDDAVAVSTAAAMGVEAVTVKDVVKEVVEFIFARGQGAASTDAPVPSAPADASSTIDGEVCEPPIASLNEPPSDASASLAQSVSRSDAAFDEGDVCTGEDGSGRVGESGASEGALSSIEANNVSAVMSGEEVVDECLAASPSASSPPASTNEDHSEAIDAGDFDEP